MATDAKLFVLAAVSKSNKPAFTVNDIVDESGISRQLVHYHLERLTKQTILRCTTRGEGSGLSIYEVNDRELLMDALLGKALEKQTKTIAPTLTIPKEALDRMRMGVDLVRAGQILTESGELREAYSLEFDDVVALFKNLKSRLNKPMTRLQAASFIKREFIDNDKRLSEDFAKDLWERYSTLRVTPELAREVFQEKQDELMRGIAE